MSAIRPLTEGAVAPAVPAAGSATAMPAPGRVRAPRARGEVARVSSDQLLVGATELLIDHHGTIYRLKQTSLGKLILTK